MLKNSSPNIRATRGVAGCAERFRRKRRKAQRSAAPPFPQKSRGIFAGNRPPPGALAAGRAPTRRKLCRNPCLCRKNTKPSGRKQEASTFTLKKRKGAARLMRGNHIARKTVQFGRCAIRGKFAPPDGLTGEA
jgi:hypothetical protein